MEQRRRIAAVKAVRILLRKVEFVKGMGQKNMSIAKKYVLHNEAKHLSSSCGGELSYLSNIISSIKFESHHGSGMDCKKCIHPLRSNHNEDFYCSLLPAASLPWHWSSKAPFLRALLAPRESGVDIPKLGNQLRKRITGAALKIPDTPGLRHGHCIVKDAL